MGNYTIFGGVENPRRGRQARNLTTNVPKILDLKSSSEQIFSKNCRWVPLRLEEHDAVPPPPHRRTKCSWSYNCRNFGSLLSVHRLQFW